MSGRKVDGLVREGNDNFLWPLNGRWNRCCLCRSHVPELMRLVVPLRVILDHRLGRSPEQPAEKDSSSILWAFCQISIRPVDLQSLFR